MSSPSTRPRLERLVDAWDHPVATKIKGALVLLTAIAGVGLYAGVVNRRYPVSDWLAWRILPLIGYVLLFELACVSGGSFVLFRLLKIRTASLLEAALFARATGVALFASLFYVAGALGLFETWFALLFATGFVLVGARDLVWRLRVELRVGRFRRPRGPAVRWLGALAGMFGAVGFFLLYLQSMTPEAINFDASWYHLPIAQDYAREGKLVPFYGDYNRAFPHLNSIVYTWGFLMPKLSAPLQWMMALHLEMAFVVWKAVGVAAAARWMLSGKRTPGLWAVFFLFPGVFVYDQNPGGSSDHFLGFFAAPVLIAAGRAVTSLGRRYCALLGLLLGGALLTKTQAIYLIGAAGAILGVRWVQLSGRLLARRLGRPVGFSVPLRELLIAAGLVLGLMVLVSLPHFAKNAVFYRDPVYPFAQRFFDAYPEHAKSALLFEKIYPNYPHLPKGEGLMRHLNALRLFFTFSFDPHYSFTKEVPNMGSLFTLLLPGALLCRRVGRIWIGIGASFVAIMVWAETYTGDRYLQGLITIPIAVTAALLVRLWSSGWLSRIGVSLLVSFQLIYGGDAPFYSGHKRMLASLELLRSGYENRRQDSQRFDKFRSGHTKLSKSIPSGAVLLARNYRTTLGIDHPIVFDIQAWQALVFYEPLKSPAQFWDLLKSRGITHLLFPKGQRPPDHLQAAILFAELARAGGDRLHGGGLTVVALPETRPPEGDEYLVVVMSVPGYRDGLYPVDSLTRYDRDKRNLVNIKPKPLEALEKGGKNLEDLLSRASAAVRGKRAKSLSAPDFEDVERFSAYTVLLRKGGVAALDPSPDVLPDDPLDPDSPEEEVESTAPPEE
jgi:hypothetical protein